jgi:hypothetical protein
LLQLAGWTPDRRVDVDEALTELGRAGHRLVAPAREFLAEYSGLTIALPDGSRVLRIDGLAAARGADPDWCSAYAASIGHAVTPIGEYSHMILVMDATGAFWGGFDADYGFMGDSIVAVVQALLVEPGSRHLDREVVD